MLQVSTIKFLKDLTKNNNKPWFDAHRTMYESARADFAGFIQQVIDKHGKKDATIKHLVAKDCMFRINRDIRFSKDKTPYKNNFGASINKGGKKSRYAGYYFHLSPGDSFEKMVSLAKKKGYDFPYLVDETQGVTTAFGATNTPHVYILSKELKVMYVGSIDNSLDERSVTKKYVESAVDALLAGKIITTTKTKTVGCTIKWKNG